MVLSGSGFNLQACIIDSVIRAVPNYMYREKARNRVFGLRQVSQLLNLQTLMFQQP